ncbi:hypothetical protein ARMSODRAFT_202636 [Armillaria solidipes]|uniref:Uncharacterized protein n=1 Tax=Armillaria solidipes TaxID=1076256 RepID=A0A2H3BZD8_9AGAR|nr:hypothetical protein ARMSODRAFT_202636 [Armillaria solidipes]
MRSCVRCVCVKSTCVCVNACACASLCMRWKKCVDGFDACACVTDVRFLRFFAILVVLVSVRGHGLHGLSAVIFD